jgi:hypothetical protein
LHRRYFVIWVVRSKAAWSKVQQVIEEQKLPLHAIFLIRKKKNYTVDFTCIVREMQKQKTLIEKGR